MASYKLSELTAVTSTDDASLIYVADTQDSGTSFSGKKITRGNLFSGIATETYVDSAISNLIDGAPAALDTLNELAAALGDADDVAFAKRQRIIHGGRLCGDVTGWYDQRAHPVWKDRIIQMCSRRLIAGFDHKDHVQQSSRIIEKPDAL